MKKVICLFLSISLILINFSFAQTHEKSNEIVKKPEVKKEEKKIEPFKKDGQKVESFLKEEAKGEKQEAKMTPKEVAKKKEIKPKWKAIPIKGEKKERRKGKAAIPLILSIVIVGGVIAALLLSKKKEDTGTVPPENVPQIKWVSIPAGSFLMGDIFRGGNANKRPVHTVYLNSYSISMYEVTFDQYDMFCDATGRSKPSDYGWGRGRRPVINVSWQDAKAFCDWLSLKTGQTIRLPTEAQWEKAARGTDQRKYPWGNGDPNSSLANYNVNVGKTMLVGSYPSGVSPYGVHDMAGNVWEWCLDWYDSGYYSVSPGSNPQGPSSGKYRVLRSGAWNQGPTNIRCAFRGYGLAEVGDNNEGFRCVRIGF